MAIEHALGRRWRARAAAVVALAAFAGGAEQAEAAHLVVTSSANSGPGSLREAIVRANGNGRADLITFTRLKRPIHLAQGLLVRGGTEIRGRSGIRIVGEKKGANSRIATHIRFSPRHVKGSRGIPMRLSQVSGTNIAIDADSLHQPLDLRVDSVALDGDGIDDTGIDVEFGGTEARVTDSIISGFAAPGAEVSYNALLRLDHTTLTGNAMGAYDLQGKLRINETVVAGNSPRGGIRTSYDSNLSVAKSTISGNVRSVRPFDGGGIFAYDGSSASVTNSTISGNSATGAGSQGGGIYGKVELTAATVTDNSAEQGGGLYAKAVKPGDFVLDSIVAGNTAPNAADCAGAPVSKGHNLLGLGGCGAAGPGDILSPDPGLAPLADNGGPTPTHALLPGSPALDAAEDVGLAFDQRGVTRDPKPEIGAFELNP